MTPAQRTKLLEKLLELERELSGKGPLKIEPNRTDDSKVGGDEDEQPLNEMMQAIASNRNRNMDGVLARVVKALGKLRDDPDSYGECEECGDELPLGRLRAMPYAEFCVTCQSSKDGPKGPATRKKLTSKAGWADAASYTLADITMLRKELVIGYVVAGFLAGGLWLLGCTGAYDLSQRRAKRIAVTAKP